MSEKTLKQINFELVSPEARLVSEPVYMAVLPATEGEMGVGPQHASYVVSLAPGVVKLIKEKDGAEQHIFIAGGFADVTGENCAVLAEHAVRLDDLDMKALAQQIADLEKEIGDADDAVDAARLEKHLSIATLKYDALKLVSS